MFEMLPLSFLDAVAGGTPTRVYKRMDLNQSDYKVIPLRNGSDGAYSLLLPNSGHGRAYVERERIERLDHGGAAYREIGYSPFRF